MAGPADLIPSAERAHHERLLEIAEPATGVIEAHHCAQRGGLLERDDVHAQSEHADGTRGVQAISPQEAGTITLAEPLLNPVWAYIFSGEEPECPECRSRQLERRLSVPARPSGASASRMCRAYPSRSS